MVWRDGERRRQDDGVEPRDRPVVATLQRQVEGGANAGSGRVAGSTENQTVSAAPLLEHGSVSSRAKRRGQVFGHTLSGQSSACSAEGQSERLAERTDPAHYAR